MTDDSSASSSSFRLDVEPGEAGAIRKGVDGETGGVVETDQPGSPEARTDGTMVDGHHRIKILRDRGIDVDVLPREIVDREDVK